jgi:hypothetical protein
LYLLIWGPKSVRHACVIGHNEPSAVSAGSACRRVVRVLQERRLLWGPDARQQSGSGLRHVRFAVAQDAEGLAGSPSSRTSVLAASEASWASDRLEAFLLRDGMSWSGRDDRSVTIDAARRQRAVVDVAIDEADIRPAFVHGRPRSASDLSGPRRGRFAR